jgi:hypothetical protein
MAGLCLICQAVQPNRIAFDSASQQAIDSSNAAGTWFSWWPAKLHGIRRPRANSNAARVRAAIA